MSKEKEGAKTNLLPWHYKGGFEDKPICKQWWVRGAHACSETLGEDKTDGKCSLKGGDPFLKLLRIQIFGSLNNLNQNVWEKEKERL